MPDAIALTGRLREAFPEIEAAEVWLTTAAGGARTALVHVSLSDDVRSERSTEIGGLVVKFFAAQDLTAVPAVFSSTDYEVARECCRAGKLGQETTRTEPWNAWCGLFAACREFPVVAARVLEARLDWYEETLRTVRFSPALPTQVGVSSVRLVLQDAWQVLFALHGKKFERGWLGWKQLRTDLPPAEAERLQGHYTFYLRVCALEYQLACYQALSLKEPERSILRPLISEARKFLAASSRHLNALRIERSAGERSHRTWWVQRRIGIVISAVAALVLAFVLWPRGPLDTEPTWDPLDAELTSAQAASVPTINVPKRISMGEPEAIPHLVAGWSGGEETSVWAEGTHSIFAFRLARQETLTMILICAPFLYPDMPRQTLAVSVNGVALADYDLENSVHAYTVTIPQERVESGLNRVDFRFGDAQVVHDVLADNGDRRALSVSFRTIELIP